MMHPRELRALMSRLNTLISRAILGKADSSPGVQTLQVEVLADEVMDGVEHLEPYGFTSSPLPGAEGIVLNVGGQRGGAVAINFHNRKFRLKGLKGGEVALYTDENDTLVFSRGNIVTLTTKHFVVQAEEDVVVETKKATVAASEELTLASPLVRLKADGIASEAYTAGATPTMRVQGNIEQDGSLASTGDHVAAGVSLRSHPHSNAGGSGNSGPPVAG